MENMLRISCSSNASSGSGDFSGFEDSAEPDIEVSFETSSSGSGSDFEVINVQHSSSGNSTPSYRRKMKTSIRIDEAITSVSSSGSKVTLYKVNVESNDICFHLPMTCVWRSYSDFVWLRKRLASSCSFMRRNIPAMPSWQLLNIFNKDVIERRKLGLQDFLQQVVQDRSFLSDAAVHLFLQSNLLVEEIQAWLDKEVDESVVELIQRGKELVTCSLNESTPVSVNKSDELNRSISSGFISSMDDSMTSGAKSSY